MAAEHGGPVEFARIATLQALNRHRVRQFNPDRKTHIGDAASWRGISMTAPMASGWSDRRVGFAPTGKRRLCTAHANSRLMHRNKFVLFAIALPWLSIGCAIPGLIPTAVSNRAGRLADVWSNADSWMAKPSQAV